MKSLIDRVWEYALKNPMGFTIDLRTIKPVKFGICVAHLETQNSFGKEGLKKAINHALNHNKIVGGWLNDENNFFYFDSVRIFPNHKLKEAIEFAKTNKQYAIYDLTNLTEIKIGAGE
jgi:hypothetical protein